MRVAENSVIHKDRSEKVVIRINRDGTVSMNDGNFRPPCVSGLRHG
jgi:hypothetical protein